MGLKETFARRGIDFAEFENRTDAVAYLKEACAGKSVAFGGSVTAKELNLYEELGQASRCSWHWNNDPYSDVNAAEVYITSANAVAQTGEIVNIDGNCNRVSSSLYGHKHVYFIIGKNKLCPDLASAWDRARNVAAPRNAKRLNRNTPCAVDGKCHDCLSDDCICSAFVIMRKKPTSCNVTLVLINETLGY